MRLAPKTSELLLQAKKLLEAAAAAAEREDVGETGIFIEDAIERVGFGLEELANHEEFRREERQTGSADA